MIDLLQLYEYGGLPAKVLYGPTQPNSPRRCIRLSWEPTPEDLYSDVDSIRSGASSSSRISNSTICSLERWVDETSYESPPLISVNASWYQDHRIGLQQQWTSVLCGFEAAFASSCNSQSWVMPDAVTTPDVGPRGINVPLSSDSGVALPVDNDDPVVATDTTPNITSTGFLPIANIDGTLHTDSLLESTGYEPLPSSRRVPQTQATACSEAASFQFADMLSKFDPSKYPPGKRGYKDVHAAFRSEVRDD
jgi:hypothetical protein